MILLGRERFLKCIMTAFLASSTNNTPPPPTTKLEPSSNIAATSETSFPSKKEGSSSLSSAVKNNNGETTAATTTVIDYSSNPTIFGQILRQEILYYPYIETDTLLSFRDRTPRAPLHALVITKQYIPSVQSLQSPSLSSNDDASIEVVSSMKEMALQIIQSQQPTAYQNQDYILAFHVPPFHSVHHLHLHVLAPASEMSFIFRYGIFATGTIWCTGVDDVLKRLKERKRAV
mmetsp:Transcript_4859/g.6462  ORF Transcript_4859/g.6462 Transcript_4859/m.6462 type:complete len:232 (-) Transcript_4859:418-1113(-)